MIGPADPRSAEGEAILRRYWDEIIARYHLRPATGQEIDATAAEFPPDVALFLLARDGDAPVGCVGLRDLGDGRGEVTKLFVVGEARGRGLGAALMGAAEAAARARGLREIILNTRHDLVEAQRLYARLGYAPAERFRDEPYADRWFRKPLG